MLPKEWLALPQEERDRLAQHYGIFKTRPIEVVNNQIASDGYSPEDLLQIPLSGLPVEGTDSPIVHQNGTDSRDTDPQDTRTQKEVGTQRTIAAEEVLIQVDAPPEGEANTASIETGDK